MENYEREVIQSEIPVLVEFFALWCGKCAMMEDVIEELSKETDGKFKICQIEIDESPSLAGKFAVEVVPTFVVMKKGKAQTVASGVLNKDTLLELLESERE